MKRKTKRLVKQVVIIIFVSILSVSITYYLCLEKQKKLSKKYEEKINKLSSTNKITAYILNKSVKANQKITKKDFLEIKLNGIAKSKNLISDINILTDTMYSRDIAKGSIVYKDMVYGADKIKNDLRKCELSSLVLPMSLVKGDYVDVRINFPSGLDYVVLSKKRLQDLARLDNDSEKKEICIFYLDSEELLRLSSSIVDAYITKGAYLYTTTYVYPNTQKAAKITYPSNANVRKLIQTDPNIINRAMIELEENKRKQLNSSISGLVQKEYINGETYIKKTSKKNSYKKEKKEKSSDEVKLTEKDINSSNDIE